MHHVGCRTLLKQMSTAGSFNLTVALPSATNQVKNFSMLSFSCERESLQMSVMEKYKSDSLSQQV